jgi:hypothetical protein
MQQHFLNNAVSICKRDAPKFGGRIDGEDHLVSWYTLSAA